MNDKLNAFLREYERLVREGKVSPLSGIEMSILRLFVDWCEEQEAKPPDLGISIHETIKVTDRMG